MKKTIKVIDTNNTGFLPDMGYIVADRLTTEDGVMYRVSDSVPNYAGKMLKEHQVKEVS